MKEQLFRYGTLVVVDMVH